VMHKRRSAHRSGHKRPPPYPPPETHEELLPVRPADLRRSGQCLSIVASPVDTNYPYSVTRMLDCVRLGSRDSEVRCARHSRRKTDQVDLSASRVGTERRCPVKQPRLPGRRIHRHPPHPVWDYIHA
jgi:hypothetical protein